MIEIYTQFFKSGMFGVIAKYLFVILPIFIPIMLIYGLWIVRYRWITMKYIDAQKKCLLEIRLPKDITKSPAAMEIFFSHLNQGGAPNYGEAFIDGRTRPWFSFEMVSTGGQVRFFVWMSQAKFKNLVEAQLYAQFPNIEIFEVEDYTKDFFYDPQKYVIFGAQYKLTKPDPFPIKTYIDYGLDADQKDEYKIDPITSVIEYLGSLKAGENAWIQIMIRKHEKEGIFHGKWEEGKDLKKEVKEEIAKIRKETVQVDEDNKAVKFPNPTKGQQAVIAALERSATKTPFDCIIRSIYITEKSSFVPINIGALVGGLKQYASSDLNGFAPALVTDAPDKLKDYMRMFSFYNNYWNNKVASMKKGLLYAYKLRSFFEYPYKNYKKCKPFVLTTEELATIFHFPSGIVSQTPTLKRVESKKSEAPANLPI